MTERRRTDATELQMQHQELAAMMTRERLGSALANRPAPEEVIARNILQAPDAEQEGASKRKRLEGFLKQQVAWIAPSSSSLHMSRVKPIRIG